MPKLNWKKSFEIGHEEIDQQHKNLFAIYNTLYDEVINGAANSDEIKLEILEEVLEYTCFHFSCEEGLMREIGYPQVSRHWRLHKDFENRIYQFYRVKSSDIFVLNSEVFKIIEQWLLEHILKEDQLIGMHLNRLKK